MSVNTLTNRANGQTILDTFFNDIHSALNGDFVGRDSSGVPAVGQNLGTVALPWGVVRTNSLVLGGSTLDPAEATAPPNRVVSGKTRTTSNQPAFITPNGAAASFLLAGATTNLVLDINGTSVSVSTDITVSGLTVAPGSNNTCLLDDAAAAADYLSKTWGEYKSQKNLTVDNMGTNITALVGKWATFKTGTEYFMAYVASATSLVKCYRGFFYNSSLAPLNRVGLTNNDTITLMSTAWIYVENNGTTVSVSYTNPTWDFTAPGSPATNDYWYDIPNNVWKRYDGASWQIINRTLVGIAVIDATNCVAARCWDFYQKPSSFNSLELEVSTTAIIKAANTYAKLYVNGNLIEYNFSLPSWNITTQLASAADMYSATEQASTLYYMYVKDDGNQVISDIEPYWRADLLGYYHPHNPWRMVGKAYNDASSNLITVSNDRVRKSDGTPYRSELQFDTGNGYGSTATRVKKYTTKTTEVGADYTHNFSTSLATNGLEVVIQEEGIYQVEVHDRINGTTTTLGLSKNSTDTTNDISGLTIAERLSMQLVETANGNRSFCGTYYFKRGDNLKPHYTNAGADSATNLSRFRIQRVG